MPIILVVDDSPTDRLLAGGLIGKEKDIDWVIEYASNGREALEFMKDLAPDVVVTDLLMPEMDGLELVAAVRQQFPQVPVILNTGQGSETLAIEALSRGAASYVPKRQLAEKLLDTIKQVLAVSRADSSYQRLSACFTRHQLALQLENDPALIPALVDLTQQMLSNMQFGDATERMHLGVALEEALLNAFYHGTLELTAAQAQEARSALSQALTVACVQERRDQPVYRERRIFADIYIDRAQARFVVRDQGRGFARSAIPHPGDPRCLEDGAGRGLVLMGSFMDEMHFNDAGNEVTLVKHREPRPGTS
jgi:CheY-like chemotaxis protein/anti-sigma regulatory factor (Ser/Thr protein kinase)